MAFAQLNSHTARKAACGNGQLLVLLVNLPAIVLIIQAGSVALFDISNMPFPPPTLPLSPIALLHYCTR